MFLFDLCLRFKFYHPLMLMLFEDKRILVPSVWLVHQICDHFQLKNFRNIIYLLNQYHYNYRSDIDRLPVTHTVHVYAPHST